MVDMLTREQRSYNMSRVKARNTGPELKLRKALFKVGARAYRLKYDLPAKPDLVFVKQRLAIFVDGCFWHKCPLHFARPETRAEFWAKKIEGNVKRDAEVNRKLEGADWRVLRIWEHEINADSLQVAEKIVKNLK